MPLTFAWKWSYQNRIGYRLYGATSGGEIEVHRELGWLQEHVYREFNHNGDPTSFQRNVLDPIGGAVIHLNDAGARSYNRWPQVVYVEFVEHLKQQYAKEMASIARSRAENPDMTFEERPLVIPRPIYWDSTSNRFENEPFYKAEEVQAA